MEILKGYPPPSVLLCAPLGSLVVCTEPNRVQLALLAMINTMSGSVTNLEGGKVVFLLHHFSTRLGWWVSVSHLIIEIGELDL